MSLATFTDAATQIGLEALVGEAGWQTRVDRKYLLTLDELDHATDVLLDADAVAVLTIDGRRSFAYRSTYLDTPDLASYVSAGRSRRRRFKVRTRDYLDTGTSWLEVKTRGPRKTTVKDRIERDGDLSADWRPFVDERLQARGVYGVDTGALRPTLRTGYRRTTMLVAADRSTAHATRATIDTELTWADSMTGRTVALGSLAIVETKGRAAPSSVDRALWRLGHRPCSISKYGVGLASVRPDLPALKWARLLHDLHQHFEAARAA